MQKYNLSIDVKKIVKDKLKPGKEYQGHTPLDLRATVILQGEDKHKKIFENEKSELWKVGFVAQEGKKEDNMPILGSATEWRDKGAANSFEDFGIKDDENPENIPF